MSYWQAFILNYDHKSMLYLQILNYESLHLHEPNHKYHTETNWRGYSMQGKWSTQAKQKNKKFPARNYRLTTGTCTTFSQMLVQMFWDKKKKQDRQGYNGTLAYDLQYNIPLAWPDRTSKPSGPANFALGSASSQLQEVLVTDLPRSFNRGERETREGGGREREMKERRGGRGGG